MDKVPIAFFAYNRPEHTKRSLEALSRCDRFKECDLYIFCDGPKDDSQKEKVEALRQCVIIWAKKLNAKVIEREENLGLARSIVTGVTSLCEKYGRAIVLEDDLVVSPDFIDYMIQALGRYQDDTNVYQISGYMFPVEHPLRPDSFLLPLTTTWGWATWERAWKYFDWNATDATDMLAGKDTRHRFELDGSYPYHKMLKGRLNGKNQSWGILWWWTVFKRGGLVVHPRKSLVWNGGLDGTGTHCGKEDLDQPSLEVFNKRILSTNISFAENSTTDYLAFDRIKVYLKNQQSMTLVKIIKRFFCHWKC